MSNETLVEDFMKDFTNYLLLKRLMEEYPEQWKKFYAEFKTSNITSLLLYEQKGILGLIWHINTELGIVRLAYPKKSYENEPF